MKKILDQIEDLSIESSFNLVTDFLKRVGAGILIGLGIAILSTPQGVMSDAEARAANVGGEVLCHVF